MLRPLHQGGTRALRLEPGYDQSVGARLITSQRDAKAIEEDREAINYFVRVLERPVNNPVPVPGLHGGQSYNYRRRIERAISRSAYFFRAVAGGWWIVCGDPIT